MKTHIIHETMRSHYKEIAHKTSPEFQMYMFAAAGTPKLSQLGKIIDRMGAAIKHGRKQNWFKIREEELVLNERLMGYLQCGYDPNHDLALAELEYREAENAPETTISPSSHKSLETDNSDKMNAIKKMDSKKPETYNESLSTCRPYGERMIE